MYVSALRKNVVCHLLRRFILHLKYIFHYIVCVNPLIQEISELALRLFYFLNLYNNYRSKLYIVFHLTSVQKLKMEQED